MPGIVNGMDYLNPNWCMVCGTDVTAENHEEVCANKIRNWNPVGILSDEETKKPRQSKEDAGE
jgi:hypothetical protein